MTNTNNTIEWLNNIAQDYDVNIKDLAMVYKAIAKFHTNEIKIRNIIEKGILKGKSDLDV